MSMSRCCWRLQVSFPELSFKIDKTRDGVVCIPDIDLQMPAGVCSTAGPTLVSDFLRSVVLHLRHTTVDDPHIDTMNQQIEKLEILALGVRKFTLLLYDNDGTSCILPIRPTSSLYQEPFDYPWQPLEPFPNWVWDVSSLADPTLVYTRFYCNGCSTPLNEDSPRYHCSECTDFDFCESCFNQAGRVHEGHLMYPTGDGGAIRDRCRRQHGGIAFMMQEAFKSYAHRPCIGLRSIDQSGAPVYTFQTYKYLYHRTIDFARGLKRLFNGQDLVDCRIALCAVNRLEWVICDFALAFLGAVSIPLATNLNEEELASILASTKTVAVVCDPDQVHKVDSIRSRSDCCCIQYGVVLSDMSTVRSPAWVSFEKVESEGALLSTELYGPRHTASEIVGFDPITDMASDVMVRRAPNDLFSLSFTSGSTGRPKGAIFTNFNWSDGSFNTNPQDDPFIIMLYRPFYYATDRDRMWVCLANGGRFALFQGSMDELIPDVQRLQPSRFSAPPRVWNMLYNQFVEELTRRLNAAAYETEDPEDLSMSRYIQAIQHFIHLSFLPRETRQLISKKRNGDQIVQKIKQEYKNFFGPRLRCLATGSAPTSQNILDWMQHCFDVAVWNSYGTTESGGITSNGYLIPGVEVKLLDVPELGYYQSHSPPQGEICVKSRNNIPGYWQNPTATQELVDPLGWVHTGDIGQLMPDGQLRIIDRKKNLFKLAQGEYVSPEALELIFNRSSYISSIFVYGDSLWQFPLAVAALSQRSVDDWKALHPSRPLDEICQDQELIHQIICDLRSLAREAGLPSYQIPHGVILSAEPFSYENGLLTVSLKLARFTLQNRFKKPLSELYDRLAADSKLESATAAGESSTIASCVDTLESIRSTVHDMICSTLIVSNLQVDHLGNCPVSPLDLGADSITVVSLQTRISSRFGLTLPLPVLWQQPVSALVRTIVAKQQGQMPPAEWAVDNKFIESIHADSVLKLEDQSVDSGSIQSSSTDILLTGATGFLGINVLVSLLSSESMRGRTVFCLVRAGQDSAQVKLVNQLSAFYPSQEASDRSANGLGTSIDISRVVAVAGDISLPRFGLADDTFVMLSSRVHIVIHCAAQVNHVLPYAALRAANVLGTCEIIKFCCSGRPKHLQHVSTMEVATLSAYKEGPPHTNPSAELLTRSSGYRISKWVAERLVCQAVSTGKLLSVTVTRPGFIGWHFASGIGNASDWLVRLCQGIQECKVCPIVEDSVRIEMSPVDWMADCIVRISTQQEQQTCNALSQLVVRHLFNRNELSAKRLFNGLQLCGGASFDFVSFESWFSQMSDATKRIESHHNPDHKSGTKMGPGMAALSTVLHMFENGFSLSSSQFEITGSARALVDLFDDSRLEVSDESIQAFSQFVSKLNS
eukprot:GILK01012966.1.p1 GENE.GILK01012966.1~~GILK01012966.1.p1  ORF type:complete len:1385 (-),score=216.44 GILK01012966.1:15-4169(-)